jgi:hypothetical protein
VHQVKGLPALPQTGTAPFSYIQLNGGDGELLQGGKWTDGADQLQVTVTKIDPASGTATITIGYPALFSTTPLAKITAPSNNAHVFANQTFSLVSKDTTFDGKQLPDANVTWTANGNTIGHGQVLPANLPQGQYDVTVTGQDPSNGSSASDSIALNVDPQAPSPTPTPAPTGSPVPTPAPAAPSAIILSPTDGSNYTFFGNSSFSLTVSGQGSANVTKYSWSDKLGLITDSKANDTLTITPTYTQVGCGEVTDVINLTVTDSYGQTAKATPVSVTLYRECIQ